MRAMGCPGVCLIDLTDIVKCTLAYEFIQIQYRYIIYIDNIYRILFILNKTFIRSVYVLETF